MVERYTRKTQNLLPRGLRVRIPLQLPILFTVVQKNPTMKKLIPLFLFGLISGFSFNVSAGNKCDISIEHDTITCTDGEDVWTCRPAGRNEYFCEGKLTSWTTDCPYCGKPRK